jgi:hypothetical protein
MPRAALRLDPVPCGVPIGDVAAKIHGAVAILAEEVLG